MITARIGAGALAIGMAVMASAAAAQNAKVTIAVQENPPQLDPVMLTFNSAYRVLPNIFDTLIAVDYQNGGALKPALATEWHRVDDLTMELKLREGVVFQDGTPFTAEDVLFSFGPERVGEGTPGHSTFSRFLDTIESVEAVDDYTIRLHTSRPDPVLELRLSGWASQIVSKDAFEAAGSWEAWQTAPIGSGPFKVTSFRPNESLVLSAFDGYWGEPPDVSEATFTVVPELSTRIAGLAAGDYDIITEVSADQIATVEGYGLRIVGGTIRNHRVITFDLDNPLLKDVRIRKALSLAINRQLLVDTIWQGRVDVTNGLQWPDYGPLYDPDRTPPQYDPESARRLLEEAGYDGTVIPYRIRNDYYASEIITAQAMVEMWREVGINVDLQIKENWDQVFAEPGTGIRDGSSPPLFADPISGLWRQYGGGIEQEAWNNDEFNRLGETLLYSMDTAERAAAHSKMLDIWEHDDPPSTILHALGVFYGVGEDVEWTPYNVSFMDLGANALQVAE